MTKPELLERLKSIRCASRGKSGLEVINEVIALVEADTEFDEILCGYLGGCGSRMNGRCERTDKCDKWVERKRDES